jgi:Winged helix DNA-binding domain
MLNFCTIMFGDPVTNAEIAAHRMKAQGIVVPQFESPHQVVHWMGAMQAQDYHQVLWAIASRTKAATQRDVEQAILDRQIALSWPMRGTIHVVAAADLRWMLELCAPRRLASAASRLRQLELDERLLGRCAELFSGALEGGKVLTRSAMLTLISSAGIDPSGQRGYYILWWLAQTGLICFGPKQGKEQSFTLLEEWIPQQPRLSQEEALAELVRRYMNSRGPATAEDFAGWAGLTLTEARAGLESVRADFVTFKRDGRAFWWSEQPLEQIDHVPPGALLLPGFDEYLLGYKDRRDVLATEHAPRVVPGGNGIFLPMLVARGGRVGDGQVIGTWQRTIKKTGVAITLHPFIESDSLEERARVASTRYCTFAGLPLLTLETRPVS